MKMIYFSALGALYMFLGVFLGAIGSHALSGKLSPEALNSFGIAVRYLLIHGLVLLFLPQVVYVSPSSQVVVALCVSIGIILFSGSILVLSTKAIHGWSVSFLGPITPMGGLILLFGWGYLFVQLLRNANAA